MRHLDSHAIRPVPRTGVIYVMTEAGRQGFRRGDPTWSNLGQGQPETGALPNAPARVSEVAVSQHDFDYAPVAGLADLRQAVADLYDHLYRRGKASRYTAENVCISPGGRASLTRAVAALSGVNLGHFLPDYTAYEELLSVFRMFTPIPILLDAAQGYAFSAEDLRREVLGRGLGAVLISNPCNPTGVHLRGDELNGWTAVARDLDCLLLLDEFYSHYVYADDWQGPESAAAYVEDVNKDPVVIFDGLTKNWRYPGWRVSWSVGPRHVIDALASAGSFLDGGANAPLQRAAIPLLDPAHVEAEAKAIRETFLAKRNHVIGALKGMGIGMDVQPEGTFYAWASLKDLTPPYDDAMTFFRRALERKVICVPGEFFDVNPGKRRPGNRGHRFSKHIRISFGPSMDEVKRGLDRLAAMLPRV